MLSNSPCRLLIPAVLAAATTLAGLDAAAQAASYATTVEITRGGPTGAEGIVSSPKAACRGGRTVHLLRAGQEVGTARTTSTGAWSVKASLLAGIYQAKVDARTVTAKSNTSGTADTSKKRKKKRKKRKRYSCLAGESSQTPL
jgi:hypothetical protein